MTHILKQPLIITSAFIINILLFLLVQQMVTNKHSVLRNIERINMVDFIRIQQKPISPEDKLKKIKPDEPLPPEKSPPPPKLAQPCIPKPSQTSINIPAPDISLSSSVKGIPYLGDFLKTLTKHATVAPATPEFATDVVPTVKTKPVYPPRALRAGIEGVVTVEFIITTDGSVKDPVIIKADPPDIFDLAVLQAIKKWKFNPETDDGKPVEKRARQDIRFTLQK